MFKTYSKQQLGELLYFIQYLKQKLNPLNFMENIIKEQYALKGDNIKFIVENGKENIPPAPPRKRIKSGMKKKGNLKDLEGSTAEKPPKGLSYSLTAFKQLSKLQQNNYLMSFMEIGKYGNRSEKHNKIRIVWTSTKCIIKKYYTVGSERMENLCKRRLENPNELMFVIPHGNTHSPPSNFDEDIGNAILKYVDSLNPEPWPYQIRKGVTTVLSSQHTLRKIYNNFINERQLQSLNTCCWETFRTRWKHDCYHVGIITKLCDVCNVCKTYYLKKLQGIAKENDEQIFCKHREEAKFRRSIYSLEILYSKSLVKILNRDECKKHNEIIKTLQEKQYLDCNGLKFNSQFFRNSNYKFFSFDFKQNILLPTSVIQASKEYYTSKRTINVFGIQDEISDKMYSYLYDETIGGKTVNEIASMIFKLIEERNDVNSDTYLTFYADNCGAQNKNRFMVFFLVLLVLLKKVASVRLKFMVVGHTHFSPDRVFSNISQKLGNTTLNTPDDIMEGCKDLKAIEQMKKLETVYNWKELFETFSPIPEISTTAEIMVHKDYPGMVFYDNNLVPNLIPDTRSYSSSHLVIDVNRTSIPNINTLKVCEKNKISESKKKAMRETYQKGLVLKQHFRYYFSEEKDWGIKTAFNK
jgi:hypothetical protein